MCDAARTRPPAGAGAGAGAAAGAGTASPSLPLLSPPPLLSCCLRAFLPALSFFFFFSFLPAFSFFAFLALRFAVAAAAAASPPLSLPLPLPLPSLASPSRAALTSLRDASTLSKPTMPVVQSRWLCARSACGRAGRACRA